MKARLLLSSIAATLIFAFTTTPVLAAAWSYTTGFEASSGYSVGNINGQDSWSVWGGTTSAVSTTQAYEGTQSFAQTGNGGAIRDVTDANDDGSTVYFAVRSTNMASGREFVVIFIGANGTVNIGSIYFNRSGNANKWFIRQGAGAESYFDQSQLSTLSNDIWYCIGVKFDFTADTMQANINGGTFGTSTALGTNRSEVDRIQTLLDSAGTASDFYLDGIGATAGCGLGGGGGATPTITPFLMWFGIAAPFRRRLTI